MFRIPRKPAAIAMTAILGTGLLGGAAFAAFTPTNDVAWSIDPANGAVTMSEAPKGTDLLKTVLDSLVAKNVITQAQEDAIITALKDARTANSDVLKKVVAGLLNESATYLGFNQQELRARLPGNSLGALADKTNGKSRDGLIQDLTQYANTAIDKAVADGKITQDQAAQLKANMPARITKFVDHVWPKTAPKVDIRSFIGNALKDARDYIGLPQKDIATKLKAGESLAQIAVDAGKTRDGLIAAVMTDANAKIAQAVSDGKLTQAQADQLKTKVQDAVAKLVDRTGPAPKANAPTASN